MSRPFATLLSSPRRRRRATRIAVLLAVAGVAAVGITLIARLDGGNGGYVKDVWEPGKPVIVGNEKPVRLTPAARREINATLVRFVRAGVAKKDLAAAYELVTPAFRGGTTRAQWLRGNTPIYAYPAPTGPVANAWRLNYSYRGDVGVALMLSSRLRKTVGSVIFHIELKERRGRWLVDSFSPVATFTPIGEGPQHETGPADYAGAAADGNSAHDEKAPLSPLWIIVPAIVLGLSLLVPVGFFVIGRVRERRAVRAYGSTLPKRLPPLPRRS
jgi:hypothetical protein